MNHILQTPVPLICDNRKNRIWRKGQKQPSFSGEYRAIYNHFHNILRRLDVLPNFLFITIETMRDYYLGN